MEYPHPLKRGCVCATPLVAIGLTLAVPQTAPAQALTETELQLQLEQRDAVISDLLQRVEELESRVGADGAAPPPAVPTPAPQPRPIGAVQPAAPGTFEIDEEAVDRALERTLVREGALLLPLGAVEIEPSFTYSRDERDAPATVFDFGEGPIVTEEEFRRNIFDMELTVRAGLPFDSQVEVGLPYSFSEDQFVTSVGFADVQEESSSSSGLGDIRVGVTKTLFRERGILPDLFGNVNWDTMTGDEDEGTGSGFHEVGASLTAVKRIDPLVWIGSLSYTHAFEEDDLQPGDELGLSLGTVLAVSPETSLRFVLQQTFSEEFEFAGSDIPGSDQVASTFEFGVSSVLTPRVLLDLSAQIGVTDDAPDFQFGLSLPVRFDFPLWQEGGADQTSGLSAPPPSLQSGG